MPHMRGRGMPGLFTGMPGSPRIERRRGKSGKERSGHIRNGIVILDRPLPRRN
jgi:hypothetical protein